MKFVINGKLDDLNTYTRACRSNKYKGAQMKKANEMTVIWAIRSAKLTRIDKYPIKLKITWYEPSNRRDMDNVVAFGTKVIQDALVQSGIIEDDSRKYINRLEHVMLTDKDNPRIEVELGE